jgi:ABC-2 type transport system permease protein
MAIDVLDRMGNELTGTVALTRFVVRRDRVRIVVWIVSIAGLIALTVASIKGLYPTQASLEEAAAASHNAAAIVFNGPAQGLDTVGGEVAFQGGAMGMVVVALMSLFMIGRLTRGEEEAGRLELVRSLPVGRYTATAAASVTVAGMSLAVGALTSAVLLALSLPRSGALVFGTSFVLTGLFFGGLALLIAQLTENTRVVYGVTGAAVGAAFVLRAIGDVGNGGVSWFSPIGIAQKTRPWAGERWWPFVLLAAAIAGLLAATAAVASRRDLGRGVFEPRPGSPTASPRLGRPLGLAARLQRGGLVGWGLGVLVTGVAYGSIAPSIDAFVRDNKTLADLFAGSGGASLTDSYLATSFRIMALLGTGFAIQSVLRLRSEETAFRAEPVLATPVSRSRWAASHLAIAFGGSVVMLVVAGLATALSYGIVGGDMSVVPRDASAALVYAPAMWVLIGLTIVLVGLTPRASGLAWAILAACFIVGFLGSVLNPPHWLERASPFERVPNLPADHLSVLPLVVLTAIATGLTLVGLGGLRTRDMATQ